jgi:hypothetical protein
MNDDCVVVVVVVVDIYCIKGQISDVKHTTLRVFDIGSSLHRISLIFFLLLSSSVLAVFRGGRREPEI